MKNNTDIDETFKKWGLETVNKNINISVQNINRNTRKFFNINKYRADILSFIKQHIIFDDSVISLEINDLLDDASFKEDAQYLTFKIKINNKFFKNDLYCFTFREPENFEAEKVRFKTFISSIIGQK